MLFICICGQSAALPRTKWCVLWSYADKTWHCQQFLKGLLRGEKPLRQRCPGVGTSCLLILQLSERCHCVTGQTSARHYAASRSTMTMSMLSLYVSCKAGPSHGAQFTLNHAPARTKGTRIINSPRPQRGQGRHPAGPAPSAQSQTCLKVCQPETSLLPVQQPAQAQLSPARPAEVPGDQERSPAAQQPATHPWLRSLVAETRFRPSPTSNPPTKPTLFERRDWPHQPGLN